MFEHSLQQTSGDDLAKLLLLKSPSSEVWFDRRTNFTRSHTHTLPTPDPVVFVSYSSVHPVPTVLIEKEKKSVILPFYV